MKRLSQLLLGLAAGATTMFGAQKSALDISNIEPPYWWVGMANDTLQIMLTGNGIGASDISVNYPGVALIDDVQLESPNYKLIYLTIAPETNPGTMEIKLTAKGRKATTVSYELRKRDKAPQEYTGFDASDVLYLLMPDRFAQGRQDAGKLDLEYNPGNDRDNPNARHGGDIKGIEDHIGYLSDLGVTALWVCPVLENDMPGGSYHGYATTNYYRIDPRFGTNQEWNHMIEQAHRSGMKVVMDMIFNHSGSNHPWMKDMPTADWYNHPAGDVMTNFRLTTVHDPYASEYDLDRTVNGWFVEAMPDLNQKNPHVMKYLTQNSIWWVESSKINGIRMDTYPYADMDGMAQWAKAVMQEYPNFNIVGECWYGSEAGGAFWQAENKINPKNTNLPTVMDFFYVTKGRQAFTAQTDPWHGLNEIYDHLAQDFLYPEPQKILTFLDNHDSDRFLLEEPENLGIWKQAQALLLTSRGIPQIYYGTELLMSGSKEGSDGYIRKDFPGGFPGDSINAFTPEGRTDIQNEAYDFLSRVLNWRKGKANDIIAKGRLKHFMPQNGIYTYERRLGDRQVVVMMNGNDSPLDITMERTLEIMPYGSTYHDIVSGTDITIQPEMSFAPRQVMILEPVK